MKFNQFFQKCLQKKATFLTVGIDPDPQKLPTGFAHTPQGVYNFCREVISATSDLIPAYKFNFAFFELWGWRGMRILERLIAEVPEDILLIADAKRGDIGNSAKFYARAILDTLNFRAVTISPYLGSDSLKPFIENDEKGAFVLCLTSNPAAGQLQEHGGEKSLYLRTAELVRELNTNRNLGLVIGATKPEQLISLRQQFPELPFLIPGIGHQGGETERAVMVCRQNGLGLINLSRGILYPEEGKFPDNIRTAAKYYHDLFKR
jgi:orotidine-5'-phosphate decarboxylase